MKSLEAATERRSNFGAIATSLLTLVALAAPTGGWGSAEAADYDPCPVRQPPRPVEAEPQLVSSFGCYLGYAGPKFSEFARQSLYVAVRDGTRLAVDIYKPARDGAAIQEPAPVILTYSRYWRGEEEPDGRVRTLLGTLAPGQSMAAIQEGWGHSGAHNLVRHGYIHVVAEARGTGASYGQHHGDMSGVEAMDGHDLVEWSAAQPWSNGRVGMRGHSYRGMSQHLTASAAPPHLVAIFPGVAPFDEYDASWAGTGILRKYGLAWLAREAKRDGVQEGIEGSSVNPLVTDRVLPPRVDADPDGSQRAAARAQRKTAEAGNPMRYFTSQSPQAQAMLDIIERHSGGLGIPQTIELLYSSRLLAEFLAAHPQARGELLRLRFFRDASPMLRSPQAEGANNLANLAPAINRSRVATYNWGGWFDFATRDTILWHANNRNQKKLTMGPWTHGWNEPDNPRELSQYQLLMVEELRWFDYWLKGLDNGVMTEDAVHYAVLDQPQAWTWRAAPDWPPAADEVQSLWLDAREGSLSATGPARSANIDYRIDYGVSMGDATRYHDAIGMGPLRQGDLIAHAQRSLMFESPPLGEDLVLAGHPIVELFVTANANDLEINAYLQEVDEAGAVHQLTDGVLRASHRALGELGYATFGLPRTDSTAQAVTNTPPLGRSPVKLTFDLQPLAARFQRGHRVRLVVNGADAHTNLTIPQEPPPVLSVWSGPEHPSRLRLPTLAAESHSAN